MKLSGITLWTMASFFLIVSARGADDPAKTGGNEKPQIKVQVKVIEGGESKVKAENCRGVIIGPGINQPDPFPGYKGFVGWACPIILKNGTWWMGFSPGYWHASAPTPLAQHYPPDILADYIKMGMPADVDAPTGGRLMITQSKDQGKAWSKPKTMLDTPRDDRHPTFLELENGVILCSFFAYEGVNLSEKYPAAIVMITRSLDGGRTWEEPKRPASPFFWDEIETRMIQLQDGSVILAMTGQTETDCKKIFDVLDKSGKSNWDVSTQKAAILRSTDQGVSWRLHSMIATDHELSESAVVQLPGGRLVCVSRPEGDICFSDDNGRSWTKPVTFGMRLFMPNLYVLRDGTLVCLHGSYGKGGLRVIFSTDGGQTWIAPAANYGFLIDNVYGYGAASLLPDDSLFITYQGTGGHTAEDARTMSIYGVRLKIRPDHSGIDLLPASNHNPLVGKTFIFNCDCNDVDYAAPAGHAQEWTRDFYRRAFAAGAQVFVADVALPDVVDMKDCPSGELIGARFSEEKRKTIPFYRTIAELMSQNTDTLHIACEEARKANAVILGGARMNDAHHGRKWAAESDNCLFPKVVMDHPEWCRLWKDGTRDAVLDYAVPEVRKHRLAILRDMATNYDIDGIELDWMRWCRFLPEGRERELSGELTGFVQDVRTMLDEVAAAKGRSRMILGHRVATTVDECLNMGCDVPTWVQRGLADFLAPMDFLMNDLGIRTDEFVTLVKGGACPVYPSFGTRKYSFGRMYDDNNLYEGKDNHRALSMRSLDEYRATALNWFAWGAAGGSSFNMYMWPPEQQDFYVQAIAIMSSPKLASTGPRHYIYLPVWKDHNGGYCPTGRYNNQSLHFGSDTTGKRQTFKFRMADGRRGEKIHGILRFRIYNATPEDQFAFDLNGVSFSIVKLRIQYQPTGEEFTEPQGEGALPRANDEPAVFKNSVPFSWPANMRFDIALDDCPPFNGDNELGVTLIKKSSAADKDLVMEAMEVKVEP